MMLLHDEHGLLLCLKLLLSLRPWMISKSARCWEFCWLARSSQWKNVNNCAYIQAITIKGILCSRKSILRPAQLWCTGPVRWLMVTEVDERRKLCELSNASTWCSSFIHLQSTIIIDEIHPLNQFDVIIRRFLFIHHIISRSFNWFYWSLKS